ncbi:MAG: biotin/lipoyl-containing protein, partial [Bacteroidota bacterium]
MKVPSPGESITEVQIARWIKKDGDYVEKDEEICEIDSDKATLTLSAEASGTLKILVKEGETVNVGTIVCSIDEMGKSPQSIEKGQQSTVDSPQSTARKPESAVDSPQSSAKTEKVGPKAPAPEFVDTAKKPAASSPEPKVYSERIPSPAAEKLMREKNISGDQVTPTGKGGRITKNDVSLTPNPGLTPNPSPRERGGDSAQAERIVRREKMSMLRKKVAQRLVAVKQETAMLTTFNEVDMSAIMNIRKQYKDKFKETHGVGLGFMSFFTKAVCEAMKSSP